MKQVVGLVGHASAGYVRSSMNETGHTHVQSCVCWLYGGGVDETRHRPLQVYRGGIKEIHKIHKIHRSYHKIKVYTYMIKNCI